MQATTATTIVTPTDELPHSIFYDNMPAVHAIDKDCANARPQPKMIKHVIINTVLKLSIINILLNLILIAGEIYITTGMNIPDGREKLHTSYVITSGLYFMTIGLMSAIIVTQTNKKLFQFILVTQFFGIFIALHLTIIHAELVRSDIADRISAVEKKLKYRTYFDTLFRCVVHYVLVHGVYSTILCILFVMVFFQINIQTR